MTNTPREAVYCWFDTEYTHLDHDRARLLEVALIVTNQDLEPIGARPDGIPEELLTGDGFIARLKPPPRATISQHVLDNYQPLLDRCRREGLSAAEVDGHLETYLAQFPEARSDDPALRPILAGNSIYADYYLARRFLPRFVSCLHYRMLDVTSLKLEWKHHYRQPKFGKRGNAALIKKLYRGRDPVTGDKHDAYFDVQASIAELAFYRSHLLLREQPGS